MSRLRVHNFSISADGFVAGPGQSRDHPVGVDGHRLHEWIFAPAPHLGSRDGDGDSDGDSGRRNRNATESDADIDRAFIAAGDEGIGATIMGRNMFGPLRGPWPDLGWTGWWGQDPPFHHPVFVLTHHPRPALPMAGGTTFHFIDPQRAGGISGVLAIAAEAAGGLDVRLGGGAATMSQFLRAGLVDDLHLAVVPVLLGRGERLFTGGRGEAPGDVAGGPTAALPGYRCVELAASQAAAHLRFVRIVE
jgi:dihydrofolate reductase